jgi:putative membrane protein
MMYWYGSGMGGWGYALMTMSLVLFWGPIIVGVVALVRYLGRAGQHGTGSASSTPEQVLAQRFARGEIDEDEYRRRLGILRGDGQLATKP